MVHQPVSKYLTSRLTPRKTERLCRSICHADSSRDNLQGLGAKFLAGPPGSTKQWRKVQTMLARMGLNMVESSEYQP